jgi:hypothetical protein
VATRWPANCSAWAAPTGTRSPNWPLPPTTSAPWSAPRPARPARPRLPRRQQRLADSHTLPNRAAHIHPPRPRTPRPLPPRGLTHVVALRPDLHMPRHTPHTQPHVAAMQHRRPVGTGPHASCAAT